MRGRDAEEFLGDESGFLADPAPPPRAHVELPVARARREACGGGPEDDDPTACPICRLPDAVDGDRPPLARWRRALSEQARALPEEEACRLLSSAFNRTIPPATSRRVAPRDVRRHLDHSLHLQSEEDRLLDDVVWYAVQARRQIERAGLWFEGPGGAAQVDPEGFERWQKLVGTLVRALEARRRLRGEGAEKRGVRWERRRTPHYGPAAGRSSV